MSDTVTLPLNPTDDPLTDAALLVKEVMKHFYLDSYQQNKVLLSCLCDSKVSFKWEEGNT